MNVFDPSKSMNAFAQGAAIGGNIRQRQTEAKLAPMVAAGDYKGAAQYAGQRGDLQSAEYFKAQYGEQLKGMKAEELAAATKRAEDLARTAYGLRSVPYEQRRAALQQQLPMLQQMGIDPQQLAQFDPTDQAIDGVLAQVTPLAELLKSPEYGFQNVSGVGLVRTDPRGGGAEVAMPAVKDPEYTYEVVGSDLVAIDKRDPNNRIVVGPAPVKSPLVSVSTGGTQVRSLQDVPIGQPIPEGLLPADLLEKGQVAVRANNQYGFEVVNAPGSTAATEAKVAQQKQERNLVGTDLTISNLIGSYATLERNKAITSQGNTALENLGAIYSRTPVGRFQDEIGGGVGNLENAEARQTIQGLNMNALIKMISMSDVSAKAMDSDAEMKAWLSAINSDNFESALTKLHVLDVSFGKGTALQEAYANGTIDLPTYQRVTRRLNSDPMTKQMFDRAQRYAQLGQAVGESNLTGNERTAIQDLSNATDEELLRMMTGGQ